MKKNYDTPILELLVFCPDVAISAIEDGIEDPNNSKPWNDGELGWT